MQALCRKLMSAIASILIPVLLAEVGIADPSVFKTHIDKTAVVASIVQQNGSEGSRRRERVSRLSQPLGIAVDNATGKLY